MLYKLKNFLSRYCLSVTMSVMAHSLLVTLVTLTTVQAMGDRWAWADSSYRAQRKIETPGLNRELDIDSCNDDDSISEEKVEVILPATDEEYVRIVRKVETKDTQPRNFIKDKLCAIGLAEVSIMMQLCEVTLQHLAW